MSTNEREIEVLKYKILELDAKIENMRKNNIDEKKIINLEIKRNQYEDKLGEIVV